VVGVEKLFGAVAGLLADAKLDVINDEPNKAIRRLNLNMGFL
jgi:hypothetical protein